MPRREASGRTSSVSVSTRALLAKGMHSVSATDVTKYSGCRGTSVCAMEASLSLYTVVLVITIGVATFIGLTAHAILQTTVATGLKARVEFRDSVGKPRAGSPNRLWSSAVINSFTRFLDERSRNTALYDCSTEIYVQVAGDIILSTREQLEACGFVLASTILFRYRDLPLFFVARVVPIQVLNFFKITVTTYELIHSSSIANMLPIDLVADQVIHTHWSKLKGARLDWLDGYFGGIRDTSYPATESVRRQSMQKRAGSFG